GWPSRAAARPGSADDPEGSRAEQLAVGDLRAWAVARPDVPLVGAGLELVLVAAILPGLAELVGGSRRPDAEDLHAFPHHLNVVVARFGVADPHQLWRLL